MCVTLAKLHMRAVPPQRGARCARASRCHGFTGAPRPLTALPPGLRSGPLSCGRS